MKMYQAHRIELVVGPEKLYRFENFTDGQAEFGAIPAGAFPTPGAAAADQAEVGLAAVGLQRPGRAYPQNVADRAVPRLGEQPWLISEEWRRHHERQLRSPKRDQAKVVFLGDSITQAWVMAPSYREQFAKYTPLNLGLSGEYTQNMLWRIEQGTLDGLHPGAIVVMIGVPLIEGWLAPT